jgi:YHS domain-containing protein
MKSSTWCGRLAVLFVLSAALLGAQGVNKNKRGLALKGYDTVAYFTEGSAVKGSADHVAEWGGATWRFASAEHRTKFVADPEKYAPQYGGYCAWAVSNNYTAPIDPKAWKIVEGRLYLNYNHKVQTRWEGDMAANIEKADGNWPALRDK